MSLFCIHCQKECKSQSGLTQHQKICGTQREALEHNCTFCNERFYSESSLKRHMSVCKVYKRQEDERKMQIEINVIRQQCEDKIKKILESANEEIARLKQHNQDIGDRLKYQENHLLKDNERLRKLNEKYLSKNNELEKKLTVSHNDFVYMSKQLAELKNKTTTIINNVQNNANSYQLQIFRPTMIQGKIIPPETMIYSIPSLVDHVYQLGLGNCIRTTDRSRGTTVWSDKEGNEIKDQHSMTIAELILDTLNPELVKQREYLQEQYNIQYARPEHTRDYEYMQSLSERIQFTNSLIDKQLKSKKLLAKLIAETSKNKADKTLTSTGPSYLHFIKKVQDVLIQNVSEWIEYDFKEFGSFLKKELYDDIILLDQSQNRRRKYVYICDDNKTQICVKAEELQQIMEQVWPKLNDFAYSSLEQFLSDYKSLTKKNYHIEEYLKWMMNPDQEHMEQILKGMYYLVYKTDCNETDSEDSSSEQEEEKKEEVTEAPIKKERKSRVKKSN